MNFNEFIRIFNGLKIIRINKTKFIIDNYCILKSY